MGNTTENQRTINAAVYAMQEAGDSSGLELARADLENLLRAALPYLAILTGDAEVDRLRGVLDTLRARLEDAAANGNPHDDPDFWAGREWGLTVALRSLADLYPPASKDGAPAVGDPTCGVGGSLTGPDMNRR